MSPSRAPEPRDPDAPPDPDAVACPHCGSRDVALEAAFGSQLMTSQYWCRSCRTVFERLKVEPDGDPGSWLDA